MCVFLLRPLLLPDFLQHADHIWEPNDRSFLRAPSNHLHLPGDAPAIFLAALFFGGVSKKQTTQPVRKEKPKHLPASQTPSLPASQIGRARASMRQAPGAQAWHCKGCWPWSCPRAPRCCTLQAVASLRFPRGGSLEARFEVSRTGRAASKPGWWVRGCLMDI